MVHAGKYSTEGNLNIQTIHKLNITLARKKQTMQNTVKQNYPGLVASYDTRPETRWAYSIMPVSYCWNRYVFNNRHAVQ